MLRPGLTEEGQREVKTDFRGQQPYTCPARIVSSGFVIRIQHK